MLDRCGFLTRFPATFGGWDSCTRAQPVIPVAPAEWNEVGDLAYLAAVALADEVESRWLVPESGDRVEVLANWLTLTIEQASLYGCVERTSDGFAAWIDHTRPVPPQADYHRRRRRACGSYSGQFAMWDVLRGLHTPAVDHYRLAVLAVRGDDRCEEHVSALLSRRHMALDRGGIAVHLPHALSADRDILRRHGYRVADPVCLPDAGLSLHPMWRPGPSWARGTDPGR